MPGKGKKLMGKMPPKPKDNNPPSVVYKRSPMQDTKVSGGPVYPRKRVEPTGEKTQARAFAKKTKPVTRRGGK